MGPEQGGRQTRAAAARSEPSLTSASLPTMPQLERQQGERRKPPAPADGGAPALVRRGRAARDRLLRPLRPGLPVRHRRLPGADRADAHGSTSSCACAIPCAPGSAPRSPPFCSPTTSFSLPALLYLTGGIENPFVFLIVAPVTVSAATLPPRNTIALGVLAAVATTAARLLRPAAAVAPPGGFELPTLYNVGVLASVLSGMLFLALYVWRLAKESRQMADALAATEMVLAQGAAAARARRPRRRRGARARHAALHHRRGGQGAGARRPGGRQFRRRPGAAAEPGRALPRNPAQADARHAAARSAAGPHHRQGADRGGGRTLPRLQDQDRHQRGAPTTAASAAAAEEPVGERRPGVIYGLANLVENAVDFAREKVEIKATWSEREVGITIADDGPGISPLVLDALGEPYITTRPARQRPGRRARTASRLAWDWASSLPRRCWSGPEPRSPRKPAGAGHRRHRQGELAARGVRRPSERPERHRRATGCGQVGLAKAPVKQNWATRAWALGAAARYNMLRVRRHRR